MSTIETTLAQIGNRSETGTGTVNPPVYFSTAYRHEGIGKSTGFDYSRTGNPTRGLVERAIADLEKGDQGYACSSGMAAVLLVLSLFRSDDELIVSEDLYGGTYRLFSEHEKKWNIRCRYIDTQSIEQIEHAITSKTKAIFIETPTNPLMQVTDIQAVATIAKRHGLLLIVDNTFYTPYIQQPLTDGADIVLHSATKYLGGHNDVLSGLVVAKGSGLCAELAHYHNASGAVLSPFDSWLLIRGMKTLALRMKQHEENANKIVTYLKEEDGVTDVFYPGRGGMISFRLRDEKWINPFLQSLSIITFAESLGGVESLMTYPATQTHADIPTDVRIARGVCNRLLRFSVGIEHSDDLIQDLQQAIQYAKEGVKI
ncbi:methionine biosynthesis PLP-dependent protein [Bacillus cytotoxicus]|uniref:Cystathionine gamma-synthase n=1 Tax=Bacillus cytotoxicus TaxID=580165 RepID=A0AAX2CK92_9BACI|nr:MULTISPECIES: methionine biosynthesis PLP-dependent protein [Bacillus cereus group]AWC33859.1 cystathionine gamma-synthase [Bacillus cytotoxicus]AWC37857.1 cystathionine gamma-synthase [Bacillus cytotoxicus]AWC62070.1 cystathionine gamma-synthase [Bacillus cytotoxicus]KMT49156.1 cystathionine gamma-synthase [Bacillus cytotoxicus]QTR70264.1 methionine biosynthesis PLP-dependent protein [Bacillus cytotoxicus]